MPAGNLAYSRDTTGDKGNLRPCGSPLPFYRMEEPPWLFSGAFFDSTLHMGVRRNHRSKTTLDPSRPKYCLATWRQLGVFKT